MIEQAHDAVVEGRSEVVVEQRAARGRGDARANIRYRGRDRPRARARAASQEAHRPLLELAI